MVIGRLQAAHVYTFTNLNECLSSAASVVLQAGGEREPGGRRAALPLKFGFPQKDAFTSGIYG